MARRLGPLASPVIAEQATDVDVRLAAALFAIDPGFAGGIVVRAAAGPVRDRWLADLRALHGEGAAWRQLPLHVDDDRLLGGLDLAATLQHGKPIAQRGLLAEADGGVLVLAMAERIGESCVAHVAAALDTAQARCARAGIDTRLPARFGVVALDESADDDEAIAEVLRDRLAFDVDLRAVSSGEAATWRPLPSREDLAAARARLAATFASDEIVEALCAAASALGVSSMRASVHAVRVARLSAALAGRAEVTSADAAVAARLVLANRATRLPPQSAQDEAAEHVASDEAGDAENDDDDDSAPDSDASGADESPDRVTDGPLEDTVIDAAVAAVPAGLLARLATADASNRARGAAGRAGSLQANRRRGRPAGVRRERPRDGTRLDLIATLRAAIPWQRLRGRGVEASDRSGQPRPIRIRAEDFHVARFKQRSRTTTIFTVDASGSSALNRLAEAKGAVELLLADCYVRRDSVAVLAFRGRSAELLLPPTRSLVRAKRSLAELPGGGGTPFAAGIDAARELAFAVRRRGDSAVVVVLSDGRANVARDGSLGRPRAEADAALAAREMRACGAASIFVDTSTQPHPLARELAALMGARYLFLPHAEAATLSAAVRHAAPVRAPVA